MASKGNLSEMRKWCNHKDFLWWLCITKWYIFDTTEPPPTTPYTESVQILIGYRSVVMRSRHQSVKPPKTRAQKLASQRLTSAHTPSEKV